MSAMAASTDFDVYPRTTTLTRTHEGFRRFLVNKDYSDRIWETHCMNGEWRWNRGSLIDPGFMVNKKSFGRPPPQAPHILPARPNPDREFVVLPFLAGGPRGASSQKNRESNLKRASSQAWIAHRQNIEQITTKRWAGKPTIKPRETSRNNPPPEEVYQDRVNDLPRGFKKWNVSMHWGRIKTRKEALQAILGHANLGPDGRAMEKWQEEHSIQKRPPGAPPVRLFQRDTPLEHSYMRSHSSMDDPWAPVRMVPC